MLKEQEKLLKQYEKNFKHLRALSGIKGMGGRLWIEAETEDGRRLDADVSSSLQDIDEMRMVLDNWSPKEQG